MFQNIDKINQIFLDSKSDSEEYKKLMEYICSIIENHCENEEY